MDPVNTTTAMLRSAAICASQSILLRIRARAAVTKSKAVIGNSYRKVRTSVQAMSALRSGYLGCAAFQTFGERLVTVPQSPAVVSAIRSIGDDGYSGRDGHRQGSYEGRFPVD
jgi:hypothetical protein